MFSYLNQKKKKKSLQALGSNFVLVFCKLVIFSTREKKDKTPDKPKSDSNVHCCWGGRAKNVMWKPLWIQGGFCGKTSPAITGVQLWSTVPVSSAGGSHLRTCVWSARGGSLTLRRLALPWLAALRLRGPGGGGGVAAGRDKGGMAIWLGSSWTRACTHLSQTLSPMYSDISVTSLIWAVLVLTALVEEAACCCPGFRALRICRRYGPQRLEKKLGLDIVVIRPLFLLSSGELA